MLDDVCGIQSIVKWREKYRLQLCRVETAAVQSGVADHCADRINQSVTAAAANNRNITPALGMGIVVIKYISVYQQDLSQIIL